MIPLSWICLVGLPPLALTISFFISGRRSSVRWLVPIVCIAILVTSILIIKLGFSFTTPGANVGWLWLCYFAYCLIAAFCFAVSNVWLRAVAIVITATPILLGYALGTIGIMAFFWIFGDALAPPSRTVVVSDGLVCKTDEWGSAVTDSGYTIRLYHIWPTVPFIHKEVARGTVNFNRRDSDISCESLVAQYKQQG